MRLFLEEQVWDWKLLKNVCKNHLEHPQCRHRFTQKINPTLRSTTRFLIKSIWENNPIGEVDVSLSQITLPSVYMTHFLNPCESFAFYFNQIKRHFIRNQLLKNIQKIIFTYHSLVTYSLVLSFDSGEKGHYRDGDKCRLLILPSERKPGIGCRSVFVLRESKPNIDSLFLARLYGITSSV